MAEKNNLIYTWSDFETDIIQIKKEVDFIFFKTIVGVSKGGLPLAIKLSNILDSDFKVIYASSYKDKKQTTLRIEQFNPIMWEAPILLVDDIADTGRTLKEIKDQLEIWDKRVMVLTLFYKPHSIIKPTYWFHKVPNKTWVEMPWE